MIGACKIGGRCTASEGGVGGGGRGVSPARGRPPKGGMAVLPTTLLGLGGSGS